MTYDKTMIWDHISTRMTEDATMTLHHISATTTHVMWREEHLFDTPKSTPFQSRNNTCSVIGNQKNYLAEKLTYNAIISCTCRLLLTMGVTTNRFSFPEVADIAKTYGFSVGIPDVPILAGQYRF
jgi:hypothetical protein